MKFLIVDDSNVDRHLLSSLLHELGHETEVCSDTEGVIDKLSQGQYNALFLDIVMPNQDGYKFLRALRSNDSTAKQHVIFCSSKKTVLEINYGIKRAGADEYLVKPVTKETLTEVLQKVPLA
ncbi:response regulator [Gloeothece verrucosa]|uniref:Response regulator receiver protein n=1 Tax=Gloeothece verrucosa (strain PCC 7822) TaxID=497965 RepID=E0UBR9_GLOV7|nr:response regulator [Gloeothece verrucosa]ADN14013.1 response regulator receiver protein [Gloeothece verrucosa PCC 7822]